MTPDEAAGTATESHLPRFSGFFHSLFSVFFPDQCRLCREPLQEYTPAPVCRVCLEAIHPLPAPAGLCRCCGLPLDASIGGQCRDCANGEYGFAQARSYGAYDGALREIIHLLKYAGMRPLARPLAGHMAAVAVSNGWTASEFAGIVAVPLAPERLRRRGFNQAELLAREVGRRLGLLLLKDACHRARATDVQTGLTRAQRFENMRAAFTAGRGAASIGGRDLLLVDDVLTTGATLSACARALQAAGARRVCCLTAARTL